MSSKEYWADRERKKQQKVDETTDKEIEKVRKAIDDAIKSLEDEIYRIYAKYAIDNKMSYADALKYLTDEERKEFQRDLQYYVSKYHDSAYVKAHKKELHSLSVRARVQRIELFIANIKRHSIELEELLNTGTREQISALYTEGYLRELYELSFGGDPGSKNIAPAFNAKAVKEILDTPWSGSDYSSKVWNLSDSFTQKLQEVLTQGLIQGQHPDVIARNFRRFGFGKEGNGGLAWRAEALIRTEAANIIEQAQKDAYIDTGVERYVFMTAKDHKVCDKCAPLNGKDFPIEEAAQGKNYPPMHTNCRCTTRAKNRFEDRSDEFYELFDTDYDAWLEKYVQPELDKIDQSNKAKELYNEAKKNEPGISADIREAVESTGGRLEGFDYRLKTEDSLLRKLRSEVNLGGLTLEQASSGLYDLVRYTSVADELTLVSHYHSLVENLSAKGYNVVRVKNTLKDPYASYRGVNTVVEAPGGYKFELQFHTPKSLEIKEINHKLYEEQRLDTTSKERKAELAKEMSKNAMAIPTPKDIDGILAFNKLKGGK